MKITVVSLFDAAFARLGELTLPNKEAYCAHHGYCWKVHRESLCGERHPSWSKIRAVQEVLGDSDWVFWTDADAVITDELRPLESFLDDPAIDFIIGAEYAGMNAGHFLVRNCLAVERFLERVWDAPKTLERCRGFEWTGAWEQGAITAIFAEDPHCLRYKVVGEDLAANYWHSGRNFLIHPFASPLRARWEYLDAALHVDPETAGLVRQKGKFFTEEVGHPLAWKLARIGWGGIILGEDVDGKFAGFNSVRLVSERPSAEKLDGVMVL